MIYVCKILSTKLSINKMMAILGAFGSWHLLVLAYEIVALEYLDNIKYKFSTFGMLLLQWFCIPFIFWRHLIFIQNVHLLPKLLLLELLAFWKLTGFRVPVSLGNFWQKFEHIYWSMKSANVLKVTETVYYPYRFVITMSHNNLWIWGKGLLVGIFMDSCQFLWATLIMNQLGFTDLRF